ncbi:MAG: hypothetical protein WD468_06345 [Pirellulales bacterium]
MAVAGCAAWPHEEHPLDSWYTAWLTAPPLHEEQPEQELHDELQSLHPQLGAQAVVHTGRIVTCASHELQGE